MSKHDVSHKTGSTQRIATPLEEDRVRDIRSTQSKLDEVRPCGFRVMRADRQTDGKVVEFGILCFATEY